MVFVVLYKIYNHSLAKRENKDWVLNNAGLRGKELGRGII